MSAGGMLFSYGPGEYQSGGRVFAGEIILGDYRLFLKGPGGDIAATYIPLERIKHLRRTFGVVQIQVRLSAVDTYQVVLKAPRISLDELARDLVNRRNLRRKFWGGGWHDPEL